MKNLYRHYYVVCLQMAGWMEGCLVGGFSATYKHHPFYLEFVLSPQYNYVHQLPTFYLVAVLVCLLAAINRRH